MQAWIPRVQASFDMLKRQEPNGNQPEIILA